ncbi:MAG: hypothetical protein U5K30_02775 [Acidimicrobiales bacterium]|nr:hypothetical protein [Acidimicrobiales bacterium]
MGFGFVKDAWDAGTDAAGAAWDAGKDAADDVWDAGKDAADDVWGGTKDFAGDVWEGTKDVTGSAGGWVGGGISFAGRGVDAATGGLASRAMNATDDYVFDTVDYVTGGTVDIDFDDGTFSVGVGIDDVAGLGASVGEHGLSTDGQLPGAGLGVGLTDAGLEASVTGGLDYGPLPYVDGHVNVTADGDVSVAGEIQGTVPIPGVGVLSGEASGGFVQTDQGWGTFVDADGQLTLPSGVKLAGGIDARYEATEDGSHTSLGLEGSVSAPGVGAAGGGLAYERVEQDGDVVEVFEAEGKAIGFGASVEGEANYLGIETDGVSHSEWQTDLDVRLPGETPDQQPGTGSDASNDDDVVLGNAGPATAQPEPPASAGTTTLEPGLGDDVVMNDAGFDGGLTAPAPGDGIVDIGIPPDEVVLGDGVGAGPAAPVDPAPGTFEDPAFTEPEPEPVVDSFEESIESADAVDTSFDDMFDDLQ